MPLPSLSVILPNYNHAGYLAAAMDSVLAQSLLPDEIIIIDDASTDKSLEIINDYATRHPRLIRAEVNPHNLGSMATFNKGFSMATGRYVILVSADDLVMPGYFQKALTMAEAYPSAGIIFGKMIVMDGNGLTLCEEGVDGWDAPLFAPPAVFLQEYIDRALPNHSLCGATAYRLEALKEVGLFREGLSSWADTFAARAIALKHGACYVPEPFYRWRYLQHSLSNANAGDPGFYMAIVEKAAALMRSVQFRDRFPQEHVDDWEQRYRYFLIDLHSSEQMKGLSQAKEAIAANLQSRNGH